jgi:hypothetical protein
LDRLGLETDFTPMKQKLRAGALVCALVLSLVFSLRSWRQASSEKPNEAASEVARFAGVIRTLPETAVIGYFSDRGYVTLPSTPPFPIRYAFAPRMLVWFPDQAVAEWVIGDFTTPQDYGRAGEKLSLQLVRNFGDGVVLYKR